MEKLTEGQWIEVADRVNSALQSANVHNIKAIGGTRSVTWMKKYAVSAIASSYHSISRTQARQELGWISINLDEILGKAIAGETC